jgi:ABC-type nitrate/sulfonate/bicarbonate transport system substrate-binding protein
MRQVAALLAAALAALGFVGCGGDGAEPGAPDGAAPGASATLVLDFQPNAVHSGIYAAKARGHFSDLGIELEIREPSSSADGAKLLEAGRVDFAVMDINDYGIARARGLDLVAIAAIVQRPLASVIAADPNRVRRPADLEGGTVGVTGVPSDDAVLDTILVSDGARPGAVKRITVGFNAVQALAAGRIDAATAFWNAEGVQLRQLGVPSMEFRVDEFGAPRYPELVVVAKGSSLAEAGSKGRATACDLVEALVRGYDDLTDNPAETLDALTSEVPDLDPTVQQAQLAELTGGSAFSPGPMKPPSPRLQPGAIEAWTAWAGERGLLEEPLRPQRPLACE